MPEGETAAPLPAWGAALTPQPQPAVATDSAGGRRRSRSQRRRSRRPPSWVPPFVDTKVSPEQRAEAAATLRTVVVSFTTIFTPASSLFVSGMKRIRAAATLIQRNVRRHLWRRNAMLEAYLKQWCAAQGMLTRAEFSERWRRNNAYVHRLTKRGIEVPASKDRATYLETMLQTMEEKRLDRVLMMEVLMQGYSEARVNFVKRLRAIRQRDAALAELPSFIRGYAAGTSLGLSSTALSLALGDDGGDGGYDFTLEECQARYAALKHAESEEQLLRLENGGGGAPGGPFAEPQHREGRGSGGGGGLALEESLLSGIFLEEATAPSFKAFDNRAKEEGGCDPLTPDHPATFLLAAGQRALTHSVRARQRVRFAPPRANARPVPSYDSLPATGARDERMLWTNDIPEYPRMRRSRDEALLDRAHEDALRATTAERRPSRRSLRRQSTASVAAASDTTKEGDGTPPPSDTLAPPDAPPGRRRCSDAGMASRRASLVAVPKPQVKKEKPLYRRELVPLDELEKLTPRSRRARVREAERGRQKEIQRRHAAALRSPFADVRLPVSTLGSPDARPQSRASASPRRSASRSPQRTGTSPTQQWRMAKGAHVRALAGTRRREYTPKPSVAARRWVPRPATAAPAATALQGTVPVHRQAPPIVLRPASAAAGRLPPHRVRDLCRSVDTAKAGASYDNPARVASAICSSNAVYSSITPPPWIGGHAVADDAQLRKLCQIVGRGDPALEMALRREWEAFRRKELDASRQRDDFVARPSSATQALVE